MNAKWWASNWINIRHVLTWQNDEELGEGPASMYEFEGVDYAKEPSAADKKAFDDLLSSKKIICCVFSFCWVTGT